MRDDVDLLADLNEQQRAAVAYLGGPELVIAGAGSGKTRVLTYKIAYLIARGLPAERILALTFTNKAANEMKTRIAALVGERESRQLWMGTFHSVFSKILRREADKIGYTKDFTIYDSNDSKSAVKHLIKEMELDEKAYSVKKAYDRISKMKNDLVTWQAYLQDAGYASEDQIMKMPQFGKLYANYCQRLHASNVMDFDDLLLNTNILFRDFPDVLEKYQGIFDYIAVDEYQDTNASQSRIVNLLARKHHRLCVVGDDAQSIYSFRGANIENILRFGKENEGSRIFKLERNYRSTRNIVGAANSLIHKNVNQLQKEVYSENDEGQKVGIIECSDEYDEANYVSSEIKTSLRKGTDAKNIAILYRTNAQSRVLEDALRRESIPYRIYGGQSFYQRKEIKNALAYMYVSLNYRDEESLRRIVNVPARGIGDTTLNKCLRASMEHKVPLFDVMKATETYGCDVNKGTQAKLLRFTEKIERFSKDAESKGLKEMVEEIVQDSGLLAEVSTAFDAESISRKENLMELVNYAEEMENRFVMEGMDKPMLQDFLAEAALLTDQDEEGNQDEQQSKITLMTVHSSKGLEYDTVFIVGLEEDLFPGQMAVMLSDVEEERRLLYVAITRAKKTCRITHAGSRTIYGSGNAYRKPSRFLKDIDTKFVERGQTRRTSYRGGDYSRVFDNSDDFDSFFMARQPVSRVVRPVQKEMVPSRPKGTSLGKRIKRTVQEDEDLVTPEGIKKGTWVRHSIFGKGKVTGVEVLEGNWRVKVDFGNGSERNLLMRYAKLEIIGENE